MSSQSYEPVRKLAHADVVDSFDCGQPALNQFLQRYALVNQKSNSAQTYVSYHSGCVVGFYSLAVYDLATNRVKELVVNYPLLPEYSKFQELLGQLIKHGLSIETVIERVPVSPVMSHETVKIMCVR